MSNVLVDKDKIDILANAVSIKSGEPLTLTLDEMVEAVDGIEVGGGEPNLQSKTYTVDSAGTETITADGGYDGLSEVEVSVPQGVMGADCSRQYATVSGVRKWKMQPFAAIVIGDDYGTPGFIADETVTYGNEITYNAVPTNTTVTPTESAQTIGGTNYMMEGAVTVSAMPSGTAGTPTATKGAVSNHSVSVTPSVTNTTGYITGSTKTGTAVTVSASELVSGSETKTANGTYDVTNLAELVVNVGGGTSKNVQVLQSTSRVNSSSLAKALGDLTVSKTGTYDIYWSGGRTNTSTGYTWGTQLYVDGTGYGSENTTWTNNIQSNHLSNVSLTANQKLSVYSRGRSGSSYYSFVPMLVIVEA